MLANPQQPLHHNHPPEPYSEVLQVSGNALIMLSCWRGNPGAPCILFLPATMTHPLFFRDCLENLAAAGFHVVGVHYQEHGKSPRTGRLFTFEDLVRNATDAVSYIEDHLEHNGIYVVGTSLGSMLALVLAATDTRIRAAVLQNIVMPQLPESLQISRLVAGLRLSRPVLLRVLKALARVVPRLPLSPRLIAGEERIFRAAETRRQFHDDPLTRKSYPLHFLVSLLTAEISHVTHCPVSVIAAAGDPLLPLDYEQQVFDRIQAPSKDFVVLPLDHHLVMNECVSQVIPPLLARLMEQIEPI